jgi:hypothetical protein
MFRRKNRSEEIGIAGSALPRRGRPWGRRGQGEGARLTASRTIASPPQRTARAHSHRTSQESPDTPEILSSDSLMGLAGLAQRIYAARRDRLVSGSASLTAMTTLGWSRDGGWPSSGGTAADSSPGSDK